MAIDFPGSPSTGQRHSHNNTTWEWDGSSWNRITIDLYTTDAVTHSGIAATQFARRDDDNIITGVTTFIGNGYTGVGNTVLIVEGDARVTGVLSVGQGSVSINERDIYAVGVVTGANFKTGTTNVHNVGVEAAGINVLGADTPIGTGATVYNSGLFVGKVGAEYQGVVTATTFKGAVEGNVTGNVTGNVSGSSGSSTGNAATATKLQTVRTIGGVNFDGSANINLPGVNAAGNQNTTGTAAGLSGTPDITVRNVTVTGIQTAEDVKNIDSIGIITARTGIDVTGGTFKADGLVGAAGSVLSSTGSGINWVSPQTGPQGAAGAQGHQGVQGAAGVAGAQGAQGHQGVQGAQGHQGVQGAQGHQGVQGTTGNTGAQGVQGAQGRQGAQGYQGVQGAANATTINNNADNRVITGSGTANTLEAESTLTYNGSQLSITGSQNSYLNNNILSFDRAGYSYIDQLNDNGSLVFRVTSSYTNALRLDNNAQAIFGGSLVIPDAIQHVGDLDCKIRFPGTDTISFETASNERLRITSAGDVGIGYNSPTVKLHVREGASGASSYDNRYHMICENNGEAYLGFYVPDNSYAGIRFHDTTGAEGYIDYYMATDDMHYYSTGTHIFKTAGTERLRIHSNGRISIGNNPTVHADYILHIEDSGETNIKVEGSTSTLGARISLQNNDTTANSYSQYAFNDAGGQSTSGIRGINTDQTNNYGELAFLTRNAQGTPPQERVRIDKDGKFGINQSSPTSRLHIKTDAHNESQLRLEGPNVSSSTDKKHGTESGGGDSNSIFISRANTTFDFDGGMVMRGTGGTWGLRVSASGSMSTSNDTTGEIFGVHPKEPTNPTHAQSTISKGVDNAYLRVMANGKIITTTPIQSDAGSPIWLNKTNVTSNTTVTTSHNAMSIGNIQINSGNTVTVNSGARWVIV